jgi:hypothetical protein
MHFFIDNKSRRWEVTANIPVIKKVKALLQLDLTQLFENECASMISLSTDFEKLVDTLFVLCEDQCKAAGVSDVEFGESLFGDPLEMAWFAMLDAVIDFFPNPSRREMARKIVDKAKILSDSMLESVSQKLNELPSNWREFVVLMPKTTAGVS